MLLSDSYTQFQMNLNAKENEIKTTLDKLENNLLNDLKNSIVGIYDFYFRNDFNDSSKIIISFVVYLNTESPSLLDYVLLSKKINDIITPRRVGCDAINKDKIYVKIEF